jgi:hypothetical protein
MAVNNSESIWSIRSGRVLSRLKHEHTVDPPHKDERTNRYKKTFERLRAVTLYPLGLLLTDLFHPFSGVDDQLLRISVELSTQTSTDNSEHYVHRHGQLMDFLFSEMKNVLEYSCGGVLWQPCLYVSSETEPHTWVATFKYTAASVKIQGAFGTLLFCGWRLGSPPLGEEK